MSYTLDGLRGLIRDGGMSINALSKASGVNKAALSRLMNGKATIGIASIEAVAGVLRHRVTLEPKAKRTKAKTPKGGK